MVVLVLSACPAGLRGHITRWLLEIGPGVFVGVLTARVRDLLWDRVVELARDGRAIMVYSARGEQRLACGGQRPHWAVGALARLLLVRRPSAEGALGPVTKGWSRAGKCRRARRGK